MNAKEEKEILSRYKLTLFQSINRSTKRILSRLEKNSDCQRIFAKPSRLPRWRRLSGGISRRSRAGTLLVGSTQPNNRRHVDAGSRKPARCLWPESDAPDVFPVVQSRGPGRPPG